MATLQNKNKILKKKIRECKPLLNDNINIRSILRINNKKIIKIIKRVVGENKEKKKYCRSKKGVAKFYNNIINGSGRR